MQLRLIVNNTSDLSGSTVATAAFDERGGLIGSKEAADWVLSDRQGSILPEHGRIYHLDGQFCLEAQADDSIYINGAKMPMEAGEMVQLSDGDHLQFGLFSLQAYVSSGQEAEKGDDTPHGDRDSAGFGQRFAPVAALISDDETQAHHSLFHDDSMRHEVADLHQRLELANKRDPIEMMEESSSSRTTMARDPIAALERDRQAEKMHMTSKIGDVLHAEVEEAHFVEVPDDLMPGSTYVSAPVVRSNEGSGDYATPNKPQKSQQNAKNDMDSYLEMLARTAKSPSSQQNAEHIVYDEEGEAVPDAYLRDSYLGALEEGEDMGSELVDHVVLRPLLAALGLDIRQMSMPQANRLAGDIGAALKTAIAGLMQTHRQELADKSHLAETHLHAIEDNPLRLDQSVDAAIKDLFLVQSPVHLSAQAAIEESLELLRHHRSASEVATETALATILQALSPLALARRFMKYKGHAPRSGDLDAWHWKMYQHYYAEMRSDQQGGLSRMFWEVYRQIYDREMRQRTMEQT